MSFTDFTGGLSSASEYLSAQNPIRAELQGSVADIGRFVISAEFDSSLKEIICSLLAGRGLKLPDIQICISFNLKELLGIGALQQELFDALNSLSNAMDSFLDHLKIDEVLGRINNVIAQATSIANMINFCSSPIDPVAIPNMLEDSMQSFLGAGKDLINRIGTLVPDQIGGCLTNGGFNCLAFNGGILGEICDNFAAVSSGTADQTFIDGISTECASIVAAIDQLIDNENDVPGSYDAGGSDFEEEPRDVNPDLGVLFNPQGDINYVTRIATNLQTSYQNLGSYQVVKDDGSICNNVFELFLEPGMLRLLRNPPDPTPKIAEQVPVRNYCGEIIGFTEAVTQETQETSLGTTPENLSNPGFNAGGLVTDPVDEAEALEGTVGGGTVNNTIVNQTTIEGSQTYFVSSEADQLALVSSINQGDLVFRTDSNITYLYNGGTSGTVADDFELVGSSGVVGGTNIGGATGVFESNNAGVLQFNTLAVQDGLTINSAGNVITFGDSLTASNLAGDADVFNSRVGNDFQFRSLTAGSGIALTQAANTITINTKELSNTTTTTDATPTAILTSTALPTNSAWYFEIQCTAKRTDSGTHAASFKVEGILDNTGGTFDIVVNSTNKTTYDGIGTSTGLDVTADDISGTGFRVQVTGRATETWKWACRVNYHEV